MKSIIQKLAFVIVVIFIGTTQAQIVAESMTVDYGTVAYGGDGTREFKFKNAGKEPIIITNAKGSCGCTVPEWSKEPIRPGAEGSIKIKYDTKRSGSISKTVTITTNEVESKDANGNPVYKTYTVSIKGTVKQAPSNDGVPTITNTGVPVE